MGLVDAVKDLVRRPDAFEIFRRELQKQGYRLQEINPQSELYKDGARFAYIIPDGLWMKEEKCNVDRTGITTIVQDVQSAEEEKKPSTCIVITNNAGEEFEKQVNTFYEHARAAAQKAGKELTATHPTGAAGGVMVVYCGVK